MVVYQSRGLHEGVADCGSDKLEAPFLEFAAHHSGLLGFGWHLRKVLEGVLDCFPVHKLPDISVE